ncbi:MAG: sigma-70 family RNA polymerase sigma factor [Verrucomicrobia bacterium]|nr:sigma-70 family RNA polymerase sigma factor [Verrucomicrobiota bacterium]
MLAAGGEDSPQAREAIEKLCRTYWYPVYAFVRKHGHGPDNAQDVTQEFFARVLQKGFLGEARPERGRFRWFLLSALRHFLANEWDKARAQKRGGGMRFLSLDQAAAEQRYAGELSDEETPERAYERSWSLTVIEQARRRLREEYQGMGKSARFELLHRLLPGEDDDLTQAELARQLGMPEGSVRSEVCRFRQRFAELLRVEIAHTVADPADIDDEIQHLMEVVSSRG